MAGTVAEFKNRFANPIANALAADANHSDEKRARLRMAVLHDLVAPFVHRRTAEILRSSLPAKYEIALTCRLAPLQRDVRATGRRIPTGPNP